MARPMGYCCEVGQNEKIARDIFMKIKYKVYSVMRKNVGVCTLSAELLQAFFTLLQIGLSLK